ncbi:Cox9 subunit VIIa of cytochrome c oxidase [Cylindrobasidium torrendii FP15055 ss-10]|uniref:Cytochrome c oxidase subunit 9, mitochondrial n=1 Tax=Cylindrobasidium torrendii FP15055 ss-10 TaxID=1314674 RepID=A0A0D7AYC0_9AGAR|nr:Cox9 subunit VIIa of cytochrome c oxidase [Cylindrobasidium torrendii FP15055 ss-10]
MLAPITGKLRKRFIVDMTGGLGLGIAAGYAYWYGYHLPFVANQEAFYLKLEKEKIAARQASA